MKQQLPRKLAVALLGLGVLSGSLQATLFNVDFNAHYAGPGTGAKPPSFPSGTMTGAAATGTSGDVWNAITKGSDLPLVDSTGAASSVTLTVGKAKVHGSWDNDALAAADAVALMADYININESATGATATVSIEGLALNSDYTIHLFGAGDAADQNTIFDVSGANEGKQSTLGGSASPLSSPQHYVTFTGNTGATGEVDIFWTQGGTWTAFNGFQIDVTPRQVDEIPEPSAAVLLGLIGIGLILRRNRNGLVLIS